MKKVKELRGKIKLIFSLIFITSAFFSQIVLGTENDFDVIMSDDFKEWETLTTEEKEQTIMPSTYDIDVPDSVLNKYKTHKVPSILDQILGNVNQSLGNVDEIVSSPRYCISDNLNMRVEHQGTTSECWAFAMMKALETNVALRSGVTELKDFSERHMDYATSRTFLDGTNDKGFNRNPGGGNSAIASSYLTNGQGAVLEENMPFEDNQNKINLYEIDKPVDTIVNDFIVLPSIYKTYSKDSLGNTTKVSYYNNTSSKIYSTSDVEAIRNMIKKHIVENGALATSTYASTYKYYNNTDLFKATTYNCNSTYEISDHAVTIVGWDDNYSRDNFAEGYKPSSDGAYIVLNTYGTESFGEGYLYISYEDYFVERNLYGIESTSKVNYDNLYQHDFYGGVYTLNNSNYSSGYYGVTYDRDTSKNEILESVSVRIPNYGEVEIFVNPYDDSFSEDKLIKVGTATDLTPGYHRINIEATELVGESFAVAVKQTTESGKFEFMIEGRIAGGPFDLVTSDNKSYVSFDGNTWKNISSLSVSSIDMKRADICVKAFTKEKEVEVPEETKEISYTVEYYKDNSEVPDAIETITRTVVISKNALPVEENDIDKDKYVGYKFDRTDPENLPEEIEENSVIKVYYVKKEFDYKVEYYYDGELEETKIAKAKYQDVIENIEDKTKIGYRLMTTEEGIETGIEGLVDGIVNLPLTISENSNNNIIKVYYVKDEFNYTIEYYYDEIKAEELTVTKSAKYQDIISSSDIELKDRIGYSYSKTMGTPLTISEIAENNVIRVYYEKAEFDYKIEYYYDGELKETKTSKAKYQDIIEEYEEKIITGYRLMTTEEATEQELEGLVDGVVNLPLTISENSESNVIRVYYVKDSFEYTIEYYYEGQKDNDSTVKETAKFESKIEKDNIELKSKTGYRLMTTDEGTEEGIEGLVDGVVNLPLTISANPEENIIKVYYVINNDDTKELSYTVEYYVEGEEEVQNVETIKREVQVLQETLPVKEEDINKTKYKGYKFDKTDLEEIPERVEDGFVIKVYYVKDEFKYSIHYYYDGIDDKEKTVTGKSKYLDIIENYEDKYEYGYEVLEEENLPLTISADENENIINIYYVRKQAKVIVKYVDKITNEVLDEVETIGYVGKEYNVEEKQIENYTFVEITENSSGTMEEEVITVVCYYVHKSEGVTEKYLVKETNEVLEEKTYTGNEGDSYKTTSKEFEGYELIQEEYPKNAEGTMTREKIEVIYYYKKIEEPKSDDKNNEEQNKPEDNKPGDNKPEDKPNKDDDNKPDDNEKPKDEVNKPNDNKKPENEDKKTNNNNNENNKNPNTQKPSNNENNVPNKHSTNSNNTNKQTQATVNKSISSTTQTSNTSSKQDANIAKGMLPKAGNAIINSFIVIIGIGLVVNIIRIIIKRRKTNL